MTTQSDVSVTTELLSLPEITGAPLACDVTDAPDTPEERMAEYVRLFAHALSDRQRTADAVEFTFSAKAGVAEWVTDLARRESACCPFVSHSVNSQAKRIIWRLSSSAGPEAQLLLDELYAGPERFADGMNGLLERLAGNGVVVTSPGPRRFAIDPDQRTPGLLSKIKTACGC